MSKDSADDIPAIPGDLWLLDDRSPRKTPCRLLVLTNYNGVSAVLESGAGIDFKNALTFSRFISENKGVLLARNVLLKK